MKRLVLLPLAVACGGRSAAPPAAEAITGVEPPPAPPASQAYDAVPVAATEVVPAAATDPAQAPLGAWQSERCGERGWVRALALEADGTWEGRDLVSPCPPDVTCIWSGIVEHEGTWQAVEPIGTAALTLAASQPVTPPGGAMAPPSTLRRVDTGAMDDLGCTYTPLPSLPGRVTR